MPEEPIGQTYLDRAIADGYAEITGEGRNERIRYIPAGHSERWADPEEKERAELWAELIYKYEYPPQRIGFEVSVPGRTPSNFADLVIYEDDDLKSPYFVLECKRPDLSDAAFNQSIEQACGCRASLGAKYCGAIAGRTRRLLRFDRFPPGERDRNHLTDIPINYGNPPPWRFLQNRPGRDLAAVSREELRAAIRKCHQTLWEGGKRSPIAAFGEFCKLVFIKHRDEKDLEREDGQPYNFQRREGETATQLANRINRLYAAEQAKEPNVFTESINIDPLILAQCVEHLEGISLDRTELDTKGVAFEEFMGSFFKGDFGQYFTPRELIAFAVEMMQPTRNDLVLDPACGSGGFLLYALDHVRREAGQRQTPGTIQHFQYWHDFAQHRLFGIEINDELARVAKMNMIIHDDGHTNIVGHDALDFLENIEVKNRGVAQGKFNLILTNPPFGSTIRRNEKGDGYLEQFDLRRYLSKNYPVYAEITGDGRESGAKEGARTVRERTSIKTEILFLERVHSFLKPGTGRAAVVLPDGILTNSSLQGVRHWLLNHFQLLAVVSLPQSAFSHYDASVKASIVFLRRLAEGETVSNDQAIFMALADNIGYDATGRKTFAVTVENETAGVSKVERHSCDLFDYRVFYEWSRNGSGEGDWSERRREIISNTGLVGQYREFQKDPTPFSVSPDKPKPTQSFAVRRDDIDGKLNPDYYHPERTSAIDTLTSASKHIKIVRLAEIVSFERSLIDTPGENYLSLAHVESGTGELTDSADRALGSCYTFRVDDVLFARLRPYLNKVYRAEMDGCCTTEFYVLRVKNREEMLPDYLAAVLRSQTVLAQTVHMMTGNTHPRLTLDDVASLKIPVPGVEVQDGIVAEVRRRREIVRSLRAEAEAIQREAQRWFEEQFMGSTAAS